MTVKKIYICDICKMELTEENVEGALWSLINGELCDDPFFDDARHLCVSCMRSLSDALEKNSSEIWDSRRDDN